MKKNKMTNARTIHHGEMRCIHLITLRTLNAWLIKWSISKLKLVKQIEKNEIDNIGNNHIMKLEIKNNKTISNCKLNN